MKGNFDSYRECSAAVVDVFTVVITIGNSHKELSV